ncbi:MAG: type I secretion system permease/ATPase [Alphaproteobacteria bacterium]|nr:type I secretion system permease/ATPase [Alphaproteobacteria bacterium]
MEQAETSPLRRALAACRVPLFFAAGFSAAVNVLALVAPIYTMQVFDRVISAHSVDTLIYLSLLALFALGTLALLDLARMLILARIGAFLERRLAPEAIQRSIENVLRDQPGRSDALQDLAQVRSFLSGAGICAAFDLPWMPIYFGVAWLVHPVMGQLALAGATLLLAIALVNEMSGREPTMRATAASRQVARTVHASYRNAEVIDAMGMQPALMGRWAGLIDQQQRHERKAVNRANFATGLSKFIRMALQILLMGIGAWLVMQQDMTAGAMMAGSIIVARALQPVEQTIGVWKHFVNAREAFSRLQRFLAEPPLRREMMRLPDPRGNLSVESVSFAHSRAKDALALQNVSFALTAGQSVAIVGPSGSGKSTLARLIVGVSQPRQGYVRLDNADMASWSREQIGSQIGYLPQDVELFAGTVRANIARMGDGDPEAVAAAAKLAGVHDLILRLPEGYETQIGDAGMRLSAGERQRIGLARALYCMPKLVVLDEPDSNLDTDGEASLIRALRTMKERGTTVVATTHRPTLVEALDNVLALRAGKVTMFGPRASVIAQLAANRPPQGASPRPSVVGYGSVDARRGRNVVTH